MAIRLQRVLIACGLPTIIAIVSLYWLRKRRKAVQLIQNTSTEQQPNNRTSDKTTTGESALVLESDDTYMTCKSVVAKHQLRISTEHEVFKTTVNNIQSDNNCLQLSPEEYAMQLRDNNNLGPTGERIDVQTDVNNSTNSIANQIQDSGNNSSNNNANHSSGKRQMNYQNNTIECQSLANDLIGNQTEFNCNYSNSVNSDEIVVKLNNFTLNSKQIDSNEYKSQLNDDFNRNHLKTTEQIITDKTVVEEVDNFGQKPSKSITDPTIAVLANVSSHNDNSDQNDSKSINKNQLIDDNLSDNNDNVANDCQHIPDMDCPQLIDVREDNSKQISVEVNNFGNTSDALPISQTNSLDNNTSSSACSSSASCLMTNGYETADMYQNYPDSVSNGGHSVPHSSGPFSDVNSEGSSDSGKGGSDILHATPIDVPTLSQNDETVIYQFEIPQYLCGRLIGSGGRFVTQIKRMTNTSVVINKHVFSSDMKICTLTGTKPEIREALNQIRKRFPIGEYSNVTLQQINLLNPTPTCPMPAQTCQLQLPSAISCDVILSSLVSAGHFFLQQPTHPTYPSLSRLDHHMTQTYSQQNTPLLPTIHMGMICAVPIMGGWYRAVITKVYDTEECDVMFVDYGGYSRLPVSSLRQIRYDFMSLPFQASECYLANVQPIDPESGWSADANALFEELAQGQILQAFIVGHSDNGIPLVNLFKIQGISNVFINKELVKRSLAQWIDNSA